MRLFPALLTLAASALLSGPALAAYTITWGNEVDSVNRAADGSALWNNANYDFELGTFGAFVPTTANVDSWEANWVVLDTGSYNAAAGYFAGSLQLDNNTHAGQQAYIMVRRDPNSDYGGNSSYGAERLLVTDNTSDGSSFDNWVIPSVPADQQQTVLSLAWDAVCSTPGLGDTAVVYGGVEGAQVGGDFNVPGVATCLQTHAYTKVNGGENLITTPGQLQDTWSLTLNGGTLMTGGSAPPNTRIQDSAGAFNLTAGSTIDFGVNGGGSLLEFLSTNTSGWTGTLKVWNWTGKVNTPGGTDQLHYTTHTGPSYFQGSQVQFYSDSGVTPVGYGAAFFGNQLVPIPEAGTAAGLLSLIGLIGWRERRFFLRCREARESARQS